MDEPSSINSMNEQDRQISEIIAEERTRLRNFIHRRVPDPSDVEDIVQEVFYELVEANRLLMPIDHVYLQIEIGFFHQEVAGQDLRLRVIEVIERIAFICAQRLVQQALARTFLARRSDHSNE